MKYQFITILHNLIIKDMNKTIELAPKTKISTDQHFIQDILNSKLMEYTAGSHSTDEFNNTTFFYKFGEFNDISDFDKMDEKGSEFTFYLLREAQSLTTELWMIKDNNVYVRDGFLIAFNENIEDGCTYKASLSEVFSYSSSIRVKSEFSKQEIEQLANTYESINLNDLSTLNVSGKYPDPSHFFKNNGYERMDKAMYFILGARRSSALPMKIVNYCTALECLFTTGKSEVNHSIAERVASLLEKGPEEKIKMFKFIKKAYDYRSTIIHGSSIKNKDEDLSDITTRLDSLLRIIVNEKHNVFYMNGQDFNNYFLTILFT